MKEMAYSEINNGIKQENTSHFHELLQEQLSADDTRNIDNNDSAEESGESPLDFSVKKSKPYDEVSGSESISSPSSSLNETGGNTEDRRSDVSEGNHASGLHESPDRSPLFRHKQMTNNLHLHFQRHNMSPFHDRIGQPKVIETKSDNGNGSPVGGLPNMFNELQMSLANTSVLANSFPAMAALMDPRRFAGGSKSGTRPFRAYPKDVLTMPLDNSGMIPQYLSSLANFENSSVVQGLNLSSEEVFSIYKQQLMALRERDKYLETVKMSQQATVRSTANAASTTVSMSPSTTSISSHQRNGSQNGSNESISSTPMSTNQSESDNLSPQLTASGRRRPRSLPDEQKDDAYWERRRKNNEAAKRSRDARRAKEDEIAIRAALLEQENLKLRVEVAALKTETAKLRCMLYNS